MSLEELVYDWNTIEPDLIAPGRHIGFDDETLRDGLQSPSVTEPSVEKKIELLHLMDALGIDTADIGLPGAGGTHAAGVERLVVLSQLGSVADSPVRFLRYHAAVEQHVRDSGMDFTFLRPNLYFQGLFAVASSIVGNGVLPAPIGDARVSAVDVRDIAAVAAAALTDDDHGGATYTLTGPEAITHAEMAAALSEATGRDVRFVDVPPDDFAAAVREVLPPWQVDGLLEDYAHYRRGEASEVTDVVDTVVGRPAIPFAQFVHDYADRFART